MEINGIPAHPLVIHAAVVLTPVAVLMALAALVPSLRARLHLPLAVLAVVALVSVQLAVMTGEDLLDTRGPGSPLIAEHEERAELLRNVMIVFTLLAVALAVLARRARSAADAATTRSTAVVTVLSVSTALVGVAALVLVVITGDLGAESVWG